MAIICTGCEGRFTDKQEFKDHLSTCSGPKSWTELNERKDDDNGE